MLEQVLEMTSISQTSLASDEQISKLCLKFYLEISDTAPLMKRPLHDTHRPYCRRVYGYI
jgi:hypothetical protein